MPLYGVDCEVSYAQGPPRMGPSLLLFSSDQDVEFLDPTAPWLLDVVMSPTMVVMN